MLCLRETVLNASTHKPPSPLTPPPTHTTKTTYLHHLLVSRLRQTYYKSNRFVYLYKKVMNVNRFYIVLINMLFIRNSTLIV